MIIDQEQLNIKSIAEVIDDYGSSGYGRPEMAIMTLALENTIEKEITSIRISNDAGVRRYLHSLKHYKMNEKWEIGSTDFDYVHRLQNDIYHYYCLKGMKVEKQLTGEDTIMVMLKGEQLSDDGIYRMWHKLHKLFFDMYKKVVKNSEFIPDAFDDVICKAVKEFKYDYEHNQCEYVNPEPLLFMLGFLSELSKYVEEEKPKESTAPF